MNFHCKLYILRETVVRRMKGTCKISILEDILEDKLDQNHGLCAFQCQFQHFIGEVYSFDTFVMIPRCRYLFYAQSMRVLRF